MATTGHLLITAMTIVIQSTDHPILEAMTTVAPITDHLTLEAITIATLIIDHMAVIINTKDRTIGLEAEQKAAKAHSIAITEIPHVLEAIFQPKCHYVDGH